MLAGLVTGSKQVELVEFPAPLVEPDKAVVDISYCGICGTDLHAWLSGAPYNPAICGHEWVGTVSACHRDVNTCQEGDRVAIGGRAACGSCATCLRGDSAHCEIAFAAMIGVGPLAAPHGGFASQIAIDGGRLYQVHADLSDVQAGMLEPVTVAVHAVRQTPIRLGDVVIVIGGGPIGLFVLQCARAAGAGATVLLEPQAARRTVALNVGADHAFDPLAEDFADTLAACVGSGGADVVFECAGIPQTIDQSVRLARRGGVVSLVGVPTGAAQISAAEWLVKEVRLNASIAALREEFLIAQDLVASGRVQTAPLHTGTVGLDGLAGAFAQLADSPEQMKVLVDPRL